MNERFRVEVRAEADGATSAIEAAQALRADILLGVSWYAVTDLDTGEQFRIPLDERGNFAADAWHDDEYTYTLADKVREDWAHGNESDDERSNDE